jgi:hypothetical protein
MPNVRRPSNLILLPLTAGVARGETLGDAMALAYQSNPTLQAQRATQRALDEAYVQAIANFRPQITVQSSISTESNNEAADTMGRLAGKTQLNSNSIQISQPLYTGGRIAAGVSAAVAGVLAGRETLRAAEETTLQNVVQVYVDVRRDQKVSRSLRKTSNCCNVSSTSPERASTLATSPAPTWPRVRPVWPPRARSWPTPRRNWRRAGRPTSRSLVRTRVNWSPNRRRPN